ncbi:MAG TPA: GTP-binding protein [Planctomycetota bacterium]|nr:GTP-binding protein [Planctomycetota bacterium]
MVGTQVQTTRTVIPLHVVTGFLGSGKTTLLRELLIQSPERIAVMVNEVGDLGLDHHLIERIDEDLLVLPGGCICCSLRGELHGALARLQALEPDRIVLETTGLADPAPLLHTIGHDARLSQAVRLAGVIAVIDGPRAEDLLATHAEVRRQLDFADRVVVAKSDLTPPDRLESVLGWLQASAPGREIRVAQAGRIDPAWLLADGGFAPGDGARGLRAWLGRSPVESSTPHAPYTTHTLHHDGPVDVEAMQLWLRLVTQLDGPKLLRIKALVRSTADGACYVLQSAERSVSPPLAVQKDLPQLRGAEWVLIERGLPPAVVEALLASLRLALASA